MDCRLFADGPARLRPHCQESALPHVRRGRQKNISADASQSTRRKHANGVAQLKIFRGDRSETGAIAGLACLIHGQWTAAVLLLTAFALQVAE